MFTHDLVRVAVPATSANLGPGFDSLGLALDLVDEVGAVITGAGVRVAVTGEGADEVPTGPDHLIAATMAATFAAIGVDQPPGLAITCHNRIPHARGLGSSSAAIIAGVLLARALVRDGAQRFDDEAVLRLAARLEGHPDNVAPCLLGGVTIAWTAPEGAQAVRLEPHPGVQFKVFVPESRGFTSQARAALPSHVPHADAAFTAARAALLVHAITNDPARLFEATEDRLHQAYRASSMPETAALVARLRGAGVPAVVSGAGPTVLAIIPPGQRAPSVDAGWSCRSLLVCAAGARILGDRHAEGDPVAAGLPS